METDKRRGRDRKALVTGGATGIGWAICRRLASEGYRLVLADIDIETARARVAELGAEHVALHVDLTDRSAAAALPKLAAAALGGLDVIVNNAGMTDTSGKSLVDLPRDSFERLVALNLTGVEAICGAAPDVLGTGSAIVNLASGASWKPLALRGPYSATKAGILALTAGLGAEYRARGISVSAIAPGYTLTPLVQSLADEGLVDLETVAAGIPLGRIAQPEDIAKAVAFVASPEGRTLTGETLGVDGGGLAGPAPKGAGPLKGTAPKGRIAVLNLSADLTTDTGMAALKDLDQVAQAGPLSAVIDATLLGQELEAHEILAHIRQTAIHVAQAERTADFALLFVLGQADKTTGMAAVAAGGMLARTIAQEWAPSGMRVNALEWQGTPTQDLLETARFLVSPDASLITGQVVRAAGDPGPH
ncbi:MAG: SDR family oxidoreductase [Sulfitobacter sp.]|nr:SDR family oxidoreductase [Sulfitobacter sp.]